MNDYKLDLEKYATLARTGGRRGMCTSGEWRSEALPLREGEMWLFLPHGISLL